MSDNRDSYTLKPLAYPFDGLEPYMNRQTLQMHYEKFAKSYVDRLDKALEKCPGLRRRSLEYLLCCPSEIPDCLKVPFFRFGGGIFNHNFFFASLRPGRKENRPVETLAQAIDSRFGSFESFRAVFQEKAQEVFGSGWLWLVKDKKGCLMILKTANQDTPISRGCIPLIAVDLWEHAYITQYSNQRAVYTENWFQIINWDYAEKQYAEGCVSSL